MQNISIDIIYTIVKFIDINHIKNLKTVSKKFNIVCNHIIKIKSKTYLEKLILSPIVYNNVFKSINSNYYLLDILTKLNNSNNSNNSNSKNEYNISVMILRSKLLNISLCIMETNLNNLKKKIENLKIKSY